MVDVKINKAIKEIVGYVYQSGDLNTEYFAGNRAQIGTEVHQIIQKQYQKDECEVIVVHTMSVGEHEFVMSGRMDLLLKRDTGWIVGEIKSTTRNLDQVVVGDRPSHYAQAKFYAYILLIKNPDLEEITVRLIYCDLDGKQTREFDEVYIRAELEDFVTKTLEIYLEWVVVLVKSQNEKLKTAKALAFPFGEFRKYQRELSGAVFTCIKERKNLLLRAPTGIGKTMATIFPSLKAISKTDAKIFYLTAKTLGRTVAEKAFEICNEKGLRAKVTTITAKEKVCFMDEVRCDPKFCPYARGYFDRERKAVRDLFTSEFLFNRETIDEYARKHEVCPFEFSLAMALISDAVIGDYNYLFDPRAYLRRFFEEPSSHVVLIDEAHNLYDRACDMFSATLGWDSISHLRELFKNVHPPLGKALESLQMIFKVYRKELVDDGFNVRFDKDLDEKLLKQVENTQNILEKYLQQNYDDTQRNLLINFYFDLLQFKRIAEYYTASFRMQIEDCHDDFQISIICLDPGEHLAARLENVDSAILFSATLHPLDYFHSVLLNEKPAEQLFIPSPFDRERLDFTVNHGISTKYNARTRTAPMIAQQLFEMTRTKTGNYFIFFPSYQYMEQLFELYVNLVGNEQKIIMQERKMDEPAREEFLSEFTKTFDQTLVAFAVLGGIFSEGIDLIDDALIGAVIVGVGFPQINPLTQQRREYFDEKFGDGHRYAYVIPGFNKVMQAVGRVIRTETDEGAVLLIDDRYMNKEYLDLFPYEWQHAKFKK